MIVKFLIKQRRTKIRYFILNTLLIGGFLTTNLQAHSMDNRIQQDGMMESDMMQHMKDVTEEDLLQSLNNQEKTLYQQLNPQQKALVLKAANQFSCRSHMQMMRQKMMQQGMNKYRRNVIQTD